MPAVTETFYKQKVLELSDGSKTTRLLFQMTFYKCASTELQYATQLFEESNKEIVQQMPHCIDTNVSAKKVEAIPNEDILDCNVPENEENVATALCTADKIFIYF